jgi:hypothetical protein
VLIPIAVLRRIEAGEVTLAFRAWSRPTVRTGGHLTTAIGRLAIDAIDPVDPAAITDAEARAAGAADADALRASLRIGPGRTTYRIALRLDGPDPRLALREDADLDPDARADLDRRLDAMDRRTPSGPWTRRTLGAIAEHPGVVSTELASLLGQERQELKVRIRRLKALGLTESLEVGYRLSPRGERYVAGP